MYCIVAISNYKEKQNKTKQKDQVERISNNYR